jgi:hypothetical protein
VAISAREQRDHEVAHAALSGTLRKSVGIGVAASEAVIFTQKR